MKIERLLWDPGNIAHIARHRVNAKEVEEVCQGEPVFQVTYANRVLVTGPTIAGRMLAVVLDSEEDTGTFYVVTARPASRKERRAYYPRERGEP